MRAVLVADAVDRDLGLLGDFLDAAGARPHYLDRGAPIEPNIDGDILILLGSNRSAHAAENHDVVDQEVALIRRSLEHGIPVIGICYGAQVLARALGGTSRRGPVAECGWGPVTSGHARLCPPGPWAQMHHDVFVPSLTSTVIGWNAAGPQAFIDESFGTRAIGWQFHPELTLATFERWVSLRYSGTEGTDPRAVLVDARMNAGDSAARAQSLFESTFRYLDVASRVLGDVAGS